jgi:outer membrane protein assembly factor BamD (BamD/ComL family)
MKQRWMDEAYASATRHIYDTSVEEHVCEYDPQKLMAKADSLRNAGNRSSAYNTYRKVMNAYATDDSLFEKVAYEMAQVQNENEEYNDAEAEYYAFYTMWPNSPNAEKALFTRGFILDENINNDSLALTLFDEFLKRYPQSELKESVDWLAENIRSGGKLADDLVKKIEAEE